MHVNTASAFASTPLPVFQWKIGPEQSPEAVKTKLAKKLPQRRWRNFHVRPKGRSTPASSWISNYVVLALANIGDTRSLIIHLASTTYRQLSDAQKVQAGAGPDVVRLSIGIEDRSRLIADLDRRWPTRRSGSYRRSEGAPKRLGYARGVQRRHGQQQHRRGLMHQRKIDRRAHQQSPDAKRRLQRRHRGEHDGIH